MNLGRSTYELELCMCGGEGSGNLLDSMGEETFLGVVDNPGLETWKVKVEGRKMDVMREKDGEGWRSLGLE